MCGGGGEGGVRGWDLHGDGRWLHNSVYCLVCLCVCDTVCFT